MYTQQNELYKTLTISDENYDVTVKTFNRLKVTGTPVSLNYIPKTRPRSISKAFSKAELERLKQPWDLSKSLFKD